MINIALRNPEKKKKLQNTRAAVRCASTNPFCVILFNCVFTLGNLRPNEQLQFDIIDLNFTDRAKAIPGSIRAFVYLTGNFSGLHFCGRWSRYQ